MDPGFFSGGGGGGGGGQTVRKQSGQRFFFFSFFQSSTYLQFTEGVQCFYYRENYTFPRIQRAGPPTFSRGSNFFLGGGGGPNANFYRNPYIL